MPYRIHADSSAISAVEQDNRGRDTGQFEVHVPIRQGDVLSARQAMEELLDLRETAPVVANSVRAVLEDVGFGRYTPHAISTYLMSHPEELRSTVEALNHVYPDLVGLSEISRTTPATGTERRIDPFRATGNLLDIEGGWH